MLAVLRLASGDPFPPQAEGCGFQFTSHDFDHCRLDQASPALDFIKTRLVTPRHADDSIYIYSIPVLCLCHQPNTLCGSYCDYAPCMKTVAFIARLALGAFFLYAGCVKAINPLAFSEAVRDFQIVGDPWVAWIALGLPIFEMVVGIGLMIDIVARGASTLTVVLSLGFLAIILSAMMRGLEIACQCLGSGEMIHYPSRIAQNGLLIGICVTVALLTRKTLTNQRKAPLGDSA